MDDEDRIEADFKKEGANRYKHRNSSRSDQGQYPPPGPPYYQRPMGHFSRAFTEKGYIKIFVIGIIFFFVGYMLSAVTGYMEAPDYDDYDDDENGDKYKEDLDWYNMVKRTLITTGGILKTVGIIIIMISLLVGAVIDDQLPPLARLGLLIAVGLIAAFQI
jgi:hypothetical protein